MHGCTVQYRCLHVYVGIFQLTMLNEAPSHFNLELSALGQKIRVDYTLIVKVHFCKSSVHDKLHELHSHFPQIAQRTPSIITSSCWKSTISDVIASSIDRKKGVFRTPHIRPIRHQILKSEIYMITKRKNMLMSLHLKVCHYVIKHQILLYLVYKLCHHYFELIFISD